MKSRRELISGVLIDIAKAVFIALVIGKILNPDLITWYVTVLAMIGSILITAVAVKIHPKLLVDKEWEIWK